MTSHELQHRVVIRPSTGSDVAGLAALKAAVETATYSDYGTAEEHSISLEEFCSPNYIRKLRARGPVLVAEDQVGTIIGMIAERSLENSSTEISGMYCVVPGRGIGTSLLLSAIAQLGDADTVEIEVFERNSKGRQYFEHLGFEYSAHRRMSESYAGQVLLRMSAPVERIRRALSAYRS
ncbi:N-acetyltransferase family protein [Nocardia sp. CA-129566]|uniref:GNAT family N-acetyltransferase n=1 Tax=Nocardia sp. CA-129566 TaxID=3239976 RepID=UPI003D9986F2